MDIQKMAIMGLIGFLILSNFGIALCSVQGSEDSIQAEEENNELSLTGQAVAPSAELSIHIQEIQRDDEIDSNEADWYYWVGIYDGDSYSYQESPKPVEENNDNPIVDTTHTFSLTNTNIKNYDVIITLLEEDSLSGDDLADISEDPYGGEDDIENTNPPSDGYLQGSYVGNWDIVTDTLSGHKTESYNNYRITKGVFDGNTGDENDANVVFSASDNYEPPTASMSVSSTEITVGESVSFDASSSSASPGSEINSYQWDFDGDGNYDNSGISTSYTYDNPGTYTAELKVTDDWGETQTDTVSITVEESDDEAGDEDDGGLPGFTVLTLMIALSLIALYKHQKEKR